jgi:hypothetical protein
LHRTKRLIDVVQGRITDDAIRAIDCFHALEAWMKLARDDDDDSRANRIEAAQRAQTLLEALEKNFDKESSAIVPTIIVPNDSFYNVVLQAYAVCGGGVSAAESATAMLRRWLENCRRQFGKQQSRYPEPDIRSFTTVMNSWAKSGSKKSGIPEETVLQWMEDWIHHDCQQLQAKDKSFPYHGRLMDDHTLSTLIHAWTQSGQSHASNGAMKKLKAAVDVKRSPSSEDRFQQVKLNTVVFGSVIHSFGL